MTMRRVSRYLMLFPFITAAAAADGDAADFDAMLGGTETVSIATGRPKPLRIAPAVASVVTAEDIRNSGARDLIDILNLVPGFSITRTANFRDPILSVRGFTSPFNQNTLFLLDGVPQTELVFGDRRTRLGTVPLDLIERVEVIRGPGSALYGADAFSAVVNIITRKSAGELGQATISGGTYDTVGARGFASRRWGDWDVVGAFEYRDSDQYAPRFDEDQQTRLDRLFGTRASLAPGRADLQRTEWGAQLNLTAGQATTLGLRFSGWRDLGVGTGAANTLDPFGSIDATTVAATLTHQRALGQDWQLAGYVDASMHRFAFNDLHFFPPGAFGVFPNGVAIDTEFEQRFLRGSAVLNYTGWPNHTVGLGVGGERATAKLRSERRNFAVVNGRIVPQAFRRGEGAFGVDDDGPARNLRYVYLQDEWVFHPRWTLTWGLRYDDFSDFGDVISPRGVLTWNVRRDLAAKLLYGRGFRSPSLLETRSTQVPSVRANPDLKPEKIDNFELALDYRPRLDLQTRFSLFYHQTIDQIRQQNAGGPEFRPENVGKQKGHGVELEVEWDITPRTRFSGYYAYQDNTDETTGKDAGFSPHHKLFAQLQHQRDPWFFSVRSTTIGDRDRVAEDTRGKPDRYTIIDVLARYQFSPQLDVSLDVRNLFDQDAEDAAANTSIPSDTPLPGRSFFFSLRGQL